MDVTAWRRQRRAELIAQRRSIAPGARRIEDRRITQLLLAGFPQLARLTIGFYWPFNAEVDPRVAILRLRERGARAALPVVIARNAPLEFREWTPDVATVPGVFGLPVPQSPQLVPDVVLMPPVGFDAAGYRLGYGGGYFDRTLASLVPQPLKIGLARETSRIDTIHPQPHDIPMDFVITPDGIFERTPQGLLARRTSETSAKGLSVPACPPAPAHTRINPSTPASIALRAWRTLITSWKTRPP